MSLLLILSHQTLQYPNNDHLLPLNSLRWFNFQIPTSQIQSRWFDQHFHLSTSVWKAKNRSASSMNELVNFINPKLRVFSAGLRYVSVTLSNPWIWYPFRLSVLLFFPPSPADRSQFVLIDLSFLAFALRSFSFLPWTRDIRMPTQNLPHTHLRFAFLLSQHSRFYYIHIHVLPLHHIR
jgi:hypothetical protein